MSCGRRQSADLDAKGRRGQHRAANGAIDFLLRVNAALKGECREVTKRVLGGPRRVARRSALYVAVSSYLERRRRKARSRAECEWGSAETGSAAERCALKQLRGGAS